MLLVTFHGGPGGINNVFAYGTTSADFQLILSQIALVPPTSSADSLSELRAMTVANGCLYVADGGKSISDVLCYALPPVTIAPSEGLRFNYKSTVIAARRNKDSQFETSIAHPFGIAFDGGLMYVSNQDSNVVAQVTLTSDGEQGSLGSGSQSAYLSKNYPPPDSFLDGTYVASDQGSLPHVAVTAPDVSDAQGGLGIKCHGDKVQNSVRDVLIANGILFVCNEPNLVVNMYSLADGSFVGSSNTLKKGPTHLAMCNAGLYVSAAEHLYWAQLPSSPTGAALSLQEIALTPPQSEKIGGISFDGTTAPATVYIPFQLGTGGKAGGGSTYGGSICSYTVTQSSTSAVPTFSKGSLFVAGGPSTFQDTPEFVFYMPG